MCSLIVSCLKGISCASEPFDSHCIHMNKTNNPFTFQQNIWGHIKAITKFQTWKSYSLIPAWQLQLTCISWILKLNVTGKFILFSKAHSFLYQLMEPIIDLWYCFMKLFSDASKVVVQSWQTLFRKKITHGVKVTRRELRGKLQCLYLFLFLVLTCWHKS